MKKIKLRPPTYLTKKARVDRLFERDLEKLNELYEERSEDVYSAVSDACFEIATKIKSEDEADFDQVFELVEKEVDEKIDIDELIGSLVLINDDVIITEIVSEICNKAVDLSKFKNAGN